MRMHVHTYGRETDTVGTQSACVCAHDPAPLQSEAGALATVTRLLTGTGHDPVRADALAASVAS